MTGIVTAAALAVASIAGTTTAALADAGPWVLFAAGTAVFASAVVLVDRCDRFDRRTR